MSGVYGPPAPKALTSQAAHRTLLLDTVAKVHGGQLDQKQGAQRLRAAGFPEHDNPFSNADAPGIGGVLHAVAKPLGLSRSANIEAADKTLASYRQTHPGAAVFDVAALRRGGVVTPGTGIVAQLLGGLAQESINNPGGVAALVEHPVRTAKEVAHNVAATVEHPARHPANALLLGSAVVGGTGSVLGRAAGASRALRAGEGVGAAVRRPGYAGGSLLHAPEPGVSRIYIPGGRPESVAAPRVVEPKVTAKAQARLAQLEAEHNKALDTVAAGMFGPIDRAEVARRNVSNAKALRQQAGVTRAGRPSGASGAKAQLLPTVTKERRAAAEQAVQDAIDANPDHPALAAWRVRTDEIDQLRADFNREPAAFSKPRTVSVGSVAEGPSEAVTVERPLSRNMVVRELVQKPRNARLQKRLLEQPASPGTATVRALRGTFSPQTTFGRERRAELRVTNARQAALRVEQQRATGRLSRGEHAALSIVGVEGSNAFANPAEVVARHVATHQHFANLGGDVAAHEARIADVKLARSPLENPSPRFKRAVALTRQLSLRTERDLIDSKLLDTGTARGRRDAIARIYGHEQAPPGSFFFPLSRRYTMEAPHGAPAGFQPRPSEYGMGPVQPGQHVQGLHQHFTGESVASGQIPVNVAATIADRSARVDRLLSAQRQYADLWRAASPTRRSTYDVPIRATRDVHTELRQFFGGLADHLHATPDEQLNLSAKEVDRLTGMLEANEHAGAGVGAHVPGVRWVDRRYLADLGETSPRGIVEKAADLVTNPVRTADLYLRPAYVLNLAGNLGMAGVTQGVRVFPSLRRAVIAARHDGQANTATIDSLMGASLSRSFAVGTGPLHAANQQLAEAWNALTDLYVRRSAFYHEAAKAGYSTPTEIERLLNGPQLHSKLVEVTRRANKNVVDYSLTPVESQTIRRLIYFYPWVSRGTVWALRTLVEHPGKTFTLAQLGQVGAEHAHRQLGPLPAWANQLGLIPVGARHGDLQAVLNPSSVNTYATAVQAGAAAVDTAKALIGIPHGKSASGILTPAFTLAEQATGAGDTGGKSGLIGLLESLPQYQLARRLGVVDHPSKTYPDTGVGPALGPYSAGGAYKRNINVEELRKQAKTETGSSLGKLANDLQRAVELGMLTPQDAASTLAAARQAGDDAVKTAVRRLDVYLSRADKAGMTATTHP